MVFVTIVVANDGHFYIISNLWYAMYHRRCLCFSFLYHRWVYVYHFFLDIYHIRKSITTLIKNKERTQMKKHILSTLPSALQMQITIAIFIIVSLSMSMINEPTLNVWVVTYAVLTSIIIMGITYTIGVLKRAIDGYKSQIELLNGTRLNMEVINNNLATELQVIDQEIEELNKHIVSVPVYSYTVDDITYKYKLTRLNSGVFNTTDYNLIDTSKAITMYGGHNTDKITKTIQGEVRRKFNVEDVEVLVTTETMYVSTEDVSILKKMELV